MAMRLWVYSAVIAKAEVQFGWSGGRVMVLVIVKSVVVVGCCS